MDQGLPRSSRGGGRGRDGQAMTRIAPTISKGTTAETATRAGDGQERVPEALDAGRHGIEGGEELAAKRTMTVRLRSRTMQVNVALGIATRRCRRSRVREVRSPMTTQSRSKVGAHQAGRGRMTRGRRTNTIPIAASDLTRPFASATRWVTVSSENRVAITMRTGESSRGTMKTGDDAGGRCDRASPSIEACAGQEASGSGVTAASAPGSRDWPGSSRFPSARSPGALRAGRGRRGCRR